MAIDDLLDRPRDQRRRRDEAVSELAALVRALDGLEGVGMLDDTQRRELARLRDRPRTRSTTRRRRTTATKRSGGGGGPRRGGGETRRRGGGGGGGRGG